MDCADFGKVVKYPLGGPRGPRSGNAGYIGSGNDITIAHQTVADKAADFDAIIIGAGISGMYQLYRLRELGLKV